MTGFIRRTWPALRPRVCSLSKLIPKFCLPFPRGVLCIQDAGPTLSRIQSGALGQCLFAWLAAHGRQEATIAEALAQAGYHTGFYSDVPHYMVPGMNFTRGFQQWEFIRGQAEDRYMATAAADPALLQRYRGNEARIKAHLVNVRPSQAEEEWHTARTFRGAMRFLQQNRQNEPFYLYVDSFAPHETWEAPIHYYDLYGERAKREPIWITVPYGPMLDDNPELQGSLESLKANYSGLVTLVDTWFGKLLDTLDEVGLRDNTLVVFMSDHGTNFADNGKKS